MRIGQRNPAERKTRRVRRDVVKRADYWVRGNSAAVDAPPPDPETSPGAPS
ncbi:MAG: hypothetical protein E6165_00410 [Varibaculum cambriense]|nr:hypothetical protein [Varibaculum cambriense]